MNLPSINVNQERLSQELDQLATFSDGEPPGITRVLFTESDRAARSYIKQLCLASGLTVREDALGNLFARWTGKDASLPAVGTGSHIDAIPHSGKYDGTVGVLGGLEAIRALQASTFRPHRSIELLMFTSEEPTRFGIGCVGSRALSGARKLNELAELKDADGQRLEDLRRTAGFDGDLASVPLSRDHYSSFVELHIEQGPLLEKSKIPIGIVTAIAAPAALRVQLDGAGGHAGAVLMPDRRDALCAAAEIILSVEAAAKSSGSPDAVGTTGICRVHPGAINSVPSRVILEIDVRDIRLESRDLAMAAILSAIETKCRSRNITATMEILSNDPPATMASGVIEAAENACQQLNLKWQRMVSRAYHDSLFMARLFPTGMVFVPCRDGVSHRPDEYASPVDIQHGVEVLALVLAKLAS